MPDDCLQSSIREQLAGCGWTKNVAVSWSTKLTHLEDLRLILDPPDVRRRDCRAARLPNTGAAL